MGDHGSGSVHDQTQKHEQRLLRGQVSQGLGAGVCASGTRQQEGRLERGLGLQVQFPGGWAAAAPGHLLSWNSS